MAKEEENKIVELAGAEAAMAVAFLEEEGYEAYMVGGCVRDRLMGKRPHDVDIATDALPEETKDVFLSRGYGVSATGIKHGTVTVIVDEIPMEITTYRVDGIYTDHRRPERVSFTANIEEDLARRDFTINALAWSPYRGMVDAFGGRKDLEQRVVRCVGNPAARFREDALRILRAMRFAATLGFEIEADTASAIFSEKDLLLEISAERIFSELKKLIAGKNAAAILLQYVDVLAVAIPELFPMKGFQQNNPHHIYDVWTHSVLVLDNVNRIAESPGIAGAAPDYLRLAALLHDMGKPSCYSMDQKGVGHFYGHGKKGVEMAREILLRLRADTFTRERVMLLIQYHDTPIKVDKRAIKRWLSSLGTKVFYELLMLKRADNMAQNRELFDRQPQYLGILKMTEELLAAEECFSLSDLAIDGSDLLKAGVVQGPQIGRLLGLLLAAVINGEVDNSRKSLLALAEKAQQTGYVGQI